MKSMCWQIYPSFQNSQNHFLNRWTPRLPTWRLFYPLYPLYPLSLQAFSYLNS